MTILKNNFLFVLLTLVFCLGFFLRFYQVESVPPGLYPDETALGYNAYSILQTGKDEFGESYPLYFRSFDDYKLPVYIYSTALSIKLFGLNEFAVRFPSALFGSLCLIGIFFLVRLLSKNNYFALLSAFILSINPWHVFFSRVGYEVNMATAMLVFGVLFFILAVKKKGYFLYFFLSLLFFLLAVYTYNITRLLSPLLFAALFLYYGKVLMREAKTSSYLTLILFVLGLLPFLVTLVTMQHLSGFSSHKDALILGNDVKADILQNRSYFTDLPILLQKLFFNHFVQVGVTYLKNLISFFSTAFYFVTGSNKPNQNIGGGLAMFYYLDFPFLLYGAYYGVRNRVKFLYPFYIWFVIVLVIGSAVKIVPNGTRVYPVVIPFIIFISYGYYLVITHLLTIKQKAAKVLAFVVIGGSFLYFSGLYFLSYFIRMPVEYAIDWRSEDKEAVTFIRSVEDKYTNIVIDDSAEFVYTSLLFYGGYPPQLHQKTALYKPSGLVITLEKTGKYEFRKVNWSEELTRPGTLFVTGKNVPEGVTPLRVFSYPTRPVVLYYDRKIGQFPTTDTAYVLLESVSR